MTTNLDGLDLGSDEETLVPDGLSQFDAFLHRDLLALLPDDPDDVGVAEADDQCRYDCMITTDREQYDH